MLARRFIIVTLVVGLQANNTAFAFSSDEASNRAQFLYTDARFDMLDGDYEAAIDKVTRAHFLAPSDLRIIKLRAQILWLQGHKKEALAGLEYFLTKNPELYYKLHMEAAHYCRDLKKYEEAMEHLRAAEKVDSVRALKEQGHILMRVKEYELAAQAYDKIDTENEKDKQESLYFSALASYSNFDYPTALSRLEKARSLAPDSSLFKDIEALTKSVSHANRPFWAGVSAGLMYDDNIFIDPVLENPANAVASGLADQAFLGEVWFGGRIGRISGVDVGLTGKAQIVEYSDEADGNSAFWAPGAYLGRYTGKWGFTLPYNYYNYSVAGEEERVRVHSFTPSIYWQTSERFRTDLSGLFQGRNYLDGSSGVVHYGVGLGHTLTFSNPNEFFRLSYRYDIDDADDGESGYSGYEIGISGGAKIFGFMSLQASVAFAHFDYDQRQEWTANWEIIERKDNQFRSFVQLNMEVSESSKVSLSYYYIGNDSDLSSGDLDPYDYNKNLISLTLIMTF